MATATRSASDGATSRVTVRASCDSGPSDVAPCISWRSIAMTRTLCSTVSPETRRPGGTLASSWDCVRIRSTRSPGQIRPAEFYSPWEATSVPRRVVEWLVVRFRLPHVRLGRALLKLCTNTYQAYNAWGGHSLYPTESDRRGGERRSIARLGPGPVPFRSCGGFAIRCVPWRSRTAVSRGPRSRVAPRKAPRA